MNEREKRVIVIGAGIVGASLAYHLARDGAQVTIIEAGRIAGGVTGTSFAWINPQPVPADPIAHLRSQAIAEYHRLEAEIPALEVRWTGSLSYTAEVLQAHRAAPSPSARLLAPAQIAEREPGLRRLPEQAVHEPGHGALDAVAATHALIASAVSHGARLMLETRAQRLSCADGRVYGVQTDAGPLQADVVVCASGTGTAALVQPLGVVLPMEASPAVFIRYRAQRRRVQSIVSGPEFEIRQDADGTFLAADDYVDGSQQHSPAALAQRTADAVRRHFPGIGALQTGTACVGLRPIAADGLPVIGFLPDHAGVYVCTMHPGVTLAAVVGRLASEEIRGACTAEAFVDCRPGRFGPAIRA